MQNSLVVAKEDTRSLEARLVSVANDLNNASVVLSRNVDEALRKINNRRS